MSDDIELRRAIVAFSRDQENFYNNHFKNLHAEPFRVLIDYLSKENELDEVILDDLYELAYQAIEDRREESAILARDAELKLKKIKALAR